MFTRIRRRHHEREIIGRIYVALVNMDDDAETTKELIDGVHTLRWQVRGAYYGLYGETPELDGYGLLFFRNARTLAGRVRAMSDGYTRAIRVLQGREPADEGKQHGKR